jgi:hypothetical protein
MSSSRHPSTGASTSMSGVSTARGPPSLIFSCGRCTRGAGRVSACDPGRAWPGHLRPPTRPWVLRSLRSSRPARLAATRRRCAGSASISTFPSLGPAMSGRQLRVRANPPRVSARSTACPTLSLTTTIPKVPLSAISGRHWRSYPIHMSACDDRVPGIRHAATGRPATATAALDCGAPRLTPPGTTEAIEALLESVLHLTGSSTWPSTRPRAAAPGCRQTWAARRAYLGASAQVWSVHLRVGCWT